MEKPEALRLADELPWVKHTANWAACEQAAAELRGLYAVVQAREDDVETHSAAVYEVTKLLSEVREQRDALLEALTWIVKEFKAHGRQHWPEAVKARAAIALVEGSVAAVEGEKK